MLGMTEEDVRALAVLLKPYLAPEAQGVSVSVARMHRMPGPTFLAYVDLTFSLGGTELFTVNGFKLMQKAAGGRWLATPQHKAETPNPDNSDRYLDDFKWRNDTMKEAARTAVKNHYDQGEANA